MRTKPRPLILRDGTSLLVRPAEPADTEAFDAFIDRMAVERSTTGCDASNPSEQFCLLALRTLDGAQRVVGAAEYVVTDDGCANAALGVDEAFRGLGLATGLLRRLALTAAHHDVRVLRARSGSAALLEVLRNSGVPQLDTAEAGTVSFDLGAVPTPQSREQSETRDRLATAASIHPFFHPTAVAVIGASRDPKSLGARTLRALVKNRFRGPVYAVNPKADSIGAMPCFPSVAALPREVELAIVLVPKEHVLGVVDECAAAGVRAVVVITAGFAETGDEGRARQEALLQRVRGHGMRMVGPNCMGLINADPAVRLCASFAPVFPPSGNVAMSSQSGALGLALLAAAEELGLGLSSFVSVGNKADVSGNDLLQYWEDDPQTDVILLYVESFGNPRRFARIARRIGRHKPIIAVKSGRTGAGQRAAGSHTAALAGSDTPVQALFRQTGVIRANTLEEMFDLALLLSSQPLPNGRRVGILTNAGGPGILCADACASEGMTVPELSEGTRSKLSALLPEEASVTNPVDMIASAGPIQYAEATRILLESDEVDALMIIYAPIEASDVEPVERALDAVLESTGRTKPVVECVMGEGGRGPSRSLRKGVPSYVFPEAAARVLTKVADYAAWQRAPVGVVPPHDDFDAKAARAVCRKALERDGAGWLTFDDAQAVLRAAGLPVADGGSAKSTDEAVELAERLGYPVAMKLASRTIVHKTDVGGVELDVANADAVRAAFTRIRERVHEAGEADAFEGVSLQVMIDRGTEVMVGMTQAPVFGPVVAFGLGGVHVEVLKDVVFRVTPLTDRDAHEMVRDIRGRRLLEGYRGHPKADLAALEDVLLRIGKLADQIEEIDDLDLNPIFALEPGEGCRIADARIHVRQA